MPLQRPESLERRDFHQAMPHYENYMLVHLALAQKKRW
jgi:hypothetical protein